MSNEEIKSYFDYYMENGCFPEADNKIDKLNLKIKELKEDIKNKTIEMKALEKKHRREVNELEKKLEAKTIYRLLDVGKINALAKAGWSDKQIADEMGLSVQTIKKHRYYARNKDEI